MVVKVYNLEICISVLYVYRFIFCNSTYYYLYVDLRDIFVFIMAELDTNIKVIIYNLYSSITTYMVRLNVNLGGYFSWSFIITKVDNLQNHYFVF